MPLFSMQAIVCRGPGLLSCPGIRYQAAAWKDLQNVFTGPKVSRTSGILSRLRTGIEILMGVVRPRFTNMLGIVGNLPLRGFLIMVLNSQHVPKIPEGSHFEGHLQTCQCVKIT